jgi:hypothetical protein
MKTLYNLYKELIDIKSKEDFLRVLQDNRVPENQKTAWEKNYDYMCSN